MAKMSEQEQKFWYQRFTLEGRVFYPDLLEPKVGQNGKAKYSCMFAWKMGSNDAETKRIGEFLAQVKQNYFPTIPAQYFVNPAKRFDTYQRMDGKPNPEFLRDHYWMNLSSGVDFPPPVVNKHRQPVMDKAEVYSGRNAVISLTFYKIDMEKKGVGVNINAVMLLDGGEKEGGSMSVNINDIFGSFAQDMGIQGPGQAAPAQNTQPQQTYTPGNQPAYNPNGNNGGGFL